MLMLRRVNRLTSSLLCRNISTVKVAYGSQTGTAHAFAEALKSEIQKNGIEADLVDLQNFESQLPLTASSLKDKNTTLLLLMACYGKGEPTDNARKFHDYVMSDASGLAGLTYSVFGLGSSKTFSDRFNVVGERIDKRLNELGGTRLKEFCRGDDSKDIEQDFDDWQLSIISKLKGQSV